MTKDKLRFKNDEFPVVILGIITPSPRVGNQPPMRTKFRCALLRAWGYNESIHDFGIPRPFERQ